MLTIENNKMHNGIYPFRHIDAVFLDYWHHNLSANVCYLRNLFLYEKYSPIDIISRYLRPVFSAPPDYFRPFQCCSSMAHKRAPYELMSHAALHY